MRDTMKLTYITYASSIFFPCKNLMERDTAAPFAKKSSPFLFLFSNENLGSM